MSTTPTRWDYVCDLCGVTAVDIKFAPEKWATVKAPMDWGTKHLCFSCFSKQFPSGLELPEPTE